ncbi:uncharacterized protein LOC62_05G007704 [Vanrija pseudolonga]|uniref:Uncharacterized protein n=1 Tax=Vanrija pseudolonga TaxID=143232 RepID=A0AAF0YFR7_9TREE|nr:hypothetical protein LOC62_05G007704 [Vanrija pseudolonga]
MTEFDPLTFLPNHSCLVHTNRKVGGEAGGFTAYLESLAFIEVPIDERCSLAMTTVHRSRANVLDHLYRATVGIEYIDKEFEREIPWTLYRRPLLPNTPDDQICAFIYQTFRKPGAFQTIISFRELVMRDRIAWLDGVLRTPKYPGQSADHVLAPPAPVQSTAAVTVPTPTPTNVQRPPQVSRTIVTDQRQNPIPATPRIIDRPRPVARAAVLRTINQTQNPIQPTPSIMNRPRPANLGLQRTAATPLLELSPPARTAPAQRPTDPTPAAHAVHTPAVHSPAADIPATRSPGAESALANPPPPYAGDSSRIGALTQITYEAFASRIAELQADVARSNRANFAAWEEVKASQAAVAEAEARLAVLERRAELKAHRRSWQFWRREETAGE